MRYLLAGGVTLVLALAGLFAFHSGSAGAATLPYPDTVFQDWNNAFLVQNGTGSYGSYGTAGTYYTDQLKSIGNQRAGTWIGGYDIAAAEDDYERTHSPADWTLVSNLVTTFLNDDGTNWASYDTWNDDLGWMTNATLRGYEITGNTSWLNIAETQWNDTYNRGWDSAGGGGIWENMTPEYSKCVLSNEPAVINAVELYRITGDSTYLTKAIQIYKWTKDTLVDSSGQVNECLAFPNGPSGSGAFVQISDNAYNAGLLIEAADAIYRATGDSGYAADAEHTASYFMSAHPIVADGGGRGTTDQYWLFKGIDDLCTDLGTCANYASYMYNNAAQAWSERDSLGLTWNNWLAPTTETNPDAYEMESMVGLFEDLPSTAASPFSGSYEIKSNASGLSVGVQGDSGANSAPVVQNADTGDNGASWTFVPESNGYYEIKNALTGQLLNVNGQSGAPGALIVQWPAGSITAGNDQWLPVQNGDGSWSFYNRNSGLALDDTGNSTAAGTQYDQWSPNNSANQKFSLISRSNGSGPAVGPGPVKSGLAGKCLDLNGGSTADGTKVQIYTCNNSAAQNWTASADGTLQDSGKCLDATGNGTGDGTLLEIWDCNGGANQQWEPYDGGYANPASGRCIDDPNASTADGTQLQLFDCNGSQAQTWSLPGAQPAASSGPITAGVGSGLCVDDNAASTANGNKIQIYTCNGGTAQSWTVASNGSLQVLGSCMDIAGGGTANGTLVQLYTCNGTGAQQWAAGANGSLVNPQSGRCLDDPGGSTANGTQLEIWDCNGGSNQKWTLPS